MTHPRGLSPEEAAAWRRVTATVTPLHPGKTEPKPLSLATAAAARPPVAAASPRLDKLTPDPSRKREADALPPRPLTRHGLDASWERRLAKAHVAPELSIDLHGLTLDQAHARLLAALGQALAMQARVVLVIAGKPRPHGEQDLRGQRRGAIRAKLLDWLAASPQAARIAAVRPAHPRHGGAGAVYVVLRRSR